MERSKRGQQRIVNTRGGSAEEPNWRFGLNTEIPREAVPALCDGLDFMARQQRGGSYFYPDYTDEKLGVAFEWYLPYRSWPFGYKIGVEFWVGSGPLRQIGAYVLYGPDHPKNGVAPIFSKSEQTKLQKRIIETVQVANEWRTRVHLRKFFTIHYLQLAHAGTLHQPIEIPSLNAHILPTVRLGKQNRPVSAVIQVIDARFKEEAKSYGALAFIRLCALLTLAHESYYEPYQSTLGRTALKQFVRGISPLPTAHEIYPKGKFKIPSAEEQELHLEGVIQAAQCYNSLSERERSQFDSSLFTYYMAEDLMRKQLPTMAAVALTASLKAFRGTVKCSGIVNCSSCGELKFHHDLRGEATTLATSIADLFQLKAEDKKRKNLEHTL